MSLAQRAPPRLTSESWPGRVRTSQINEAWRTVTIDELGAVGRDGAGKNSPATTSGGGGEGAVKLVSAVDGDRPLAGNKRALG